MKNMIFLLVNCYVTAAACAQPAIQWQKTYGGSYFDQANSIVQTGDGGYIVAGNTASTDGNVLGNHGGNDFWVLKLDNNGVIEWKKAFGGSNNERPNSIQQTTDGGYIVAGFTQSNNFDVSGNHGGIDCWVVKLNSIGVIMWQKALGGTGSDEAWSIRQVADGGYILAGRSDSQDGDVTVNYGDLDFWVVKLNSLGEIEWQKSLGGSAKDIGYSISQALDGGYIVAGETASSDGDVTENHGNIDYWVIKLTSIGELEWQKTYGGYNADIGWNIQQTMEGGYIVVGYTGSDNTGDVTGHHGLFDFWVLKLESSGEIAWQKAMGGTNTDWGRGIVQNMDGDYVVTGTTNSVDGDVLDNDGGTELLVFGLSSTGEIKWQKSIGGTMADQGLAINNTSDNGYILAGYAWSNDGDLSGQTIHGYNDFWIVKLSPENASATLSPQAPLSTYPNPAHTSITLEIPTGESPLQVEISDLLGRTLSRQTIANGSQADVSSLPSGLYLVFAATESGQVYVGKLWKG